VPLIRDGVLAADGELVDAVVGGALAAERRVDAVGVQVDRRLLAQRRGGGRDGGGVQCGLDALGQLGGVAKGVDVGARLARIVHAADIRADLDSDPLGPGLLAIGIGGLDVESDDQRLLERGSFVYDALYAWCSRPGNGT
jgi:hypothetical protein